MTEHPGEGHLPGGSRSIPEMAGGKAVCAGVEMLADVRRNRRVETRNARLRTSLPPAKQLEAQEVFLVERPWALEE